MPDDQNPELPLTPPPGGGEGSPGALNIQPVNIEEEMRKSYLDYSMSVIIGRALPDVRDGLKPVHRRILYTMQQMGLQPNRATRKCARIVGDVMGKYHPHGNLAVYDAFVRLAQTWSMRYPLIFGQGNFGSVDGDPPAADRYTEAKLAQVSTALLEDLDKETVDFHPNYDGSEVEPDVLPARIPNLAGQRLRRNRRRHGHKNSAAQSHRDRRRHHHADQQSQRAARRNSEIRAKAPTFRQPESFTARAGIFEAYRTGRGRFMMRAKAAIENITKDRQAIIVTEIPYQVNKARLVERIAQLVNDKDIEDISDMRDESDRDGMRIVIELKRGSRTADRAQPALQAHRRCRKASRMILLAVVNGQPREMGLIQAIKHFIDHRVDVVRRRTAYLLAESERPRTHSRRLPHRARSSRQRDHHHPRAAPTAPTPARIWSPTSAARKSTSTPPAARPSSIRKSRSPRRQADAILELQLHRLTKLSIDEISNELKQVRDNIAEYESILGSEKKLRSVIIKELEEVKKLYGDERRTRIEDEAAEIVLEDLIADEQVAVTVSHSGYMKRTPISTYRMQRRGGTGRTGMKTRDEDFVEHLFIASTHAYILIFTNKGRVYWLKVYEIPDVSAAGKGKHIGNLVGLQPGETVRTMLAVRNLEEEDKYIFFATRNGLVKKIRTARIHARMLAAASTPSASKRATNWSPPRITDGKQIIFLASHEGMAVRFDEDHVRPMGRAAYGVWGINLEEGDYVVGMATTTKPPSGASSRERLKGQSPDRGDCTESRRRRSKRLADPLRHRKRIRQAHSRRRIPPDQPRRQRRDQRQDNRASRQSGRHRAGRRKLRSHADQPVRQNHPHGFEHHPRIRPQRARRPPAATWNRATA